MAFKIAKVKTITDTVRIETPQDFGEVLHEDIDVTFVKLDTDGYLDVNRLMNGEEDIDPESDSLGDILRENIKNIEGLKSEEGEPVQFDEVVLEQLLDMPHVRVALAFSFLSIQSTGRANAESTAKAKNSRKRANTGRNRK